MTRRTKILLIATLLLITGGAWFFLGHHSASGSTLGQSVNAGIDNLEAAGVRLLELPVFMLLAAGAVLGVALALPVLKWGTRSGRLKPAAILASVIAGVGLMGLALVADHKITQLQDQVVQLRNQLSQLRMAGLQTADATPAVPNDSTPAVTSNASATKPATVASAPVPQTTPMLAVASAPAATAPTNTHPDAVAGGSTKPSVIATAPATPVPAKLAASVKTKRTTYFFDNAQVTKTLTPLFGQIGFHPTIQDDATDIVEVDMPNLPAIAYMAVINLKTPGVEIKFGGSLSQKTLTSDFARNNNCVVAINGEAGASPQANSGLGVWKGNMITAGQVVMKEDPFNRRPFLSFDRQNNVSFTAQVAMDRPVSPDAYNLIWGRLDAVIDNKVQTENERDRQPRTAMGISQDAGKLYLMVVDGRQQRYSIGFTRAEVGSFLQAFGAANGMLCDEGGSSCIYMKKFNGIVNSPSDGMERPTYTHFGVSLKTN